MRQSGLKPLNNFADDWFAAPAAAATCSLPTFWTSSIANTAAAFAVNWYNSCSLCCGNRAADGKEDILLNPDKCHGPSAPDR